MNIERILFGLAQLLVVATVISLVYSKYKDGKKSPIKKHTYYLGIGAVLMIAGSIYFANEKNLSKQDVTLIAKESNTLLKTPRDMGNGFRMEPIVGYGNTLKYTLTLLSKEPNEIDQVRENLANNNMVETTCDNPDANTYISKGITLEYVYVDAAGHKITGFTVSPADCKK